MKILIELPTWLGDCVMTTPAIENIANYYNNPKITIIGSLASVEVLKNHPKVVRKDVLKKTYWSLYKTAKDLGEFDVFFSFRSSFRSRLFKFFILSNNKYQFKNKYRNCHQVEKYNNFINDSLNANFLADKLNICLISKKNKSTVVENFHTEELGIKDSKPTLGLNPGATYGSAKRWYPQQFAKVAAELSNKYNILIFGGPDEIDIANDIEQYLIEMGVTNYQNLAGKTMLDEFMDYISHLNLFITGDSGPMHVAASLQVPTVAIFGPTDDKETSQWMNKKSIVIKKDLDCQPCMKRTCPLGHHNCMKLIEATDVLNAVNSFKR